jgi:hypothetical protein
MKRIVGLAVLAVLMLGTPGPARAGLVSFTANLNGATEVPPNASPGTGFAQIDFDTTAHTMHVHVIFSGLLGTTTASHIHAATAAPFTGNAGVATQTPTFSGFPLGVTSGVYDNTFDMTLAASYNAPFLAANGGTPGSAETALLNDALAGEAYLNIHTNTFPGGEIRGFLVQQTQAVPEPTSLALAGLGALSLLGYRLRRCKSVA